MAALAAEEMGACPDPVRALPRLLPFGHHERTGDERLSRVPTPVGRDLLFLWSAAARRRFAFRGRSPRHAPQSYNPSAPLRLLILGHSERSEESTPRSLPTTPSM
jgi:hypothetical protein